MTELVVHFLHTNDIHSRIDQMPLIAHQVKQLRRQWEARGEPVITLDLGDHMDRMHPLTEGTEGEVNVEILKALGVDLITIGNNEGLTFTKDQLNRLYRQVPFSIVVSNLFDAETGQPPAWARPYVLRQIRGVRLGFIGVTAAFQAFYRLLGWDVTSPTEAVAHWVQQFFREVDHWVVLSHIGIHEDVRLAEVLPSGSLIFGAHTHNLFPEGEWLGDCLLAEAGRYGEHLGHVEVRYDVRTRRVLRMKAEILELKPDVPADPETQAVIQRYRKQAAKVLSQPTAWIDQPLEIRYDAESDLGNLLADSLRRVTGAEIGLVNSGQLLDHIPSGLLSKGMLHQICPSPINPCRARLKGETLLRSLEQSLMKEFQERTVIGFGFRGKVLGNLSSSGLRVQYDPTAPPGQKVRQVWVGDAPLDPQRWYTVGMIDMFTFGVGYPELKNGLDFTFYLPEFLRDILEKDLQVSAYVAAARRRDWEALA